MADPEHGTRLMDFMQAWDLLASRLAPGSGPAAAPDLLLSALKLLLACYPGAAPFLPANVAADVPRPPHTPAQLAPPAVASALELSVALADLASFGMGTDSETVAAGLVLEAVSNGDISLESVERELGPIVGSIVHDALVVRRAPQRVDLYDDDASAAIRELCLSFYDTRATVVELVSRLCRLSRLSALATPESAARLQVDALEAMQIYAPMGYALGLPKLSSRLEDIAFQIVFPSAFEETTSWLRSDRIAREDALERARRELQKALNRNPLVKQLAAKCEITARSKSLVSVMRKVLSVGDMSRGGKDMRDVHDLLGMRVVVTPLPNLDEREADEMAIQACYAVRDVAAGLWPIVTGRDKDYIACPKPNGYRSLHMTSRVPAGRTLDIESLSAGADAQPDRDDDRVNVEVQIRTAAMHAAAESGSASHGRYKGGLAPGLALAAKTAALPPPDSDGGDELLPRPLDSTHEVFRLMDRDGDGRVTREELLELARELGSPAGAAAAVEGLMAVADLDGSGDLTVDELQALKRRGGADLRPSGSAARRGRPAAAVSGGFGAVGTVARPRAASVGACRAMSDGAGWAMGGRGPSVDTLEVEEAVQDADSEAARPHRRTVDADSDDESGGSAVESGGASVPRRAASAGNGNGNVRFPGWSDAAPGLRTRRSGRRVVWREAAADDGVLYGAQGVAGEDAAATTRCEQERTVRSRPRAKSDVRGAAARAARNGTGGGAGRHNSSGNAGRRRIYSKPARSHVVLVPVTDPARRLLATPDGRARPHLLLPNSGPMVVGALPSYGCDEVVDHPLISGKHCRLELVKLPDGTFPMITDLRSTNGTFLNGAPLQPFADTKLRSGDTLWLADRRLAFVVKFQRWPEGSSGPSDVARAMAVLGIHPAPADAAAASPPFPAPPSTIPVDSEPRAPFSDDAFAEEVRALVRDGRTDSARGVLTQRLLEAPGDFASWAQLANIARRNREHALARKLYRAAVEALDFAVSAHRVDGAEAAAAGSRLLRSWAMHEGRLRHDTSARRLFRLSVMRAEQHPAGARVGGAAHTLQAWAHHELRIGCPRRAQELIAEALAVDGECAEVHQLAGVMHAREGDVEEARRAFKRALECSPGMKEALHAWARLEATSGDLNLARKHFAAALEADPTNVKTLHAWAMAEAKAGRAEQARGLFRRAHAVQPDNVRVLQAWGVLEARDGDLARARSLFQDALTASPGNVVVLSALANAERAAGNLSVAREAAERALEIQPDHAPSLQELAMVERASGRAQEADALSQAAARINAGGGEPKPYNVAVNPQPGRSPEKRRAQ
ncbi:unnamed protein product [Pedinophyceae sp. YPF-701]|nr:unnamed protein product [Pedinophyceae sp. YPF-701]